MKSQTFVSSRGPVQDSPNHRYVVLKLADERDADGAPKEADPRHLDSVADLLRERFSGSSVRPLFASIDPMRIRDLVTRAAETSKEKRRQRHLLNYHRITCGDDLQAGELAKTLAALPYVETAYVEGRVKNAGPVDFEHNDYAKTIYGLNTLSPAHQGYLDEAPYGIGARYAWGFEGGDGAGTSLTAVQTSWDPNHQDLRRHTIVTVCGLNRYALPDPLNDQDKWDKDGGHGTAVLGIACGDDQDQAGIVGIAPHVSSIQMCSTPLGPTKPDNAAKVEDLTYVEAIAHATANMSAGDVLLLPLQVEGRTEVLGATKYVQHLPIEAEHAVREAIKLATSRGIVVVEAAGNGVAVYQDGDWVEPRAHDEKAGGVDLDAFTDARGQRVLNRNDREFDDSHAIMVGAAFAKAVPATQPVAHIRADKIYMRDLDVNEKLGWIADNGSGSNYGSRVDCYAWGQSVLTATPTGGMPKDETNPDKKYGAIGATSAASSIIAGVALCIQGIARASQQNPLQPERMRDALGDPRTGTPQDLRRPGSIGVMPDLKRIIEKLFPSRVPS